MNESVQSYVTAGTNERDLAQAQLKVKSLTSQVVMLLGENENLKEAVGSLKESLDTTRDSFLKETKKEKRLQKVLKDNERLVGEIEILRHSLDKT